MFCEKCGKEMLDTAKFCPSCGAPAEVVEEAADALEAEPVVEPVESSEPVEEPVEETKAAVAETPPPPPVYGKSKDLLKPLSTASYFWMFFLMAIPVIRLISLLVWSFSDNVNVNKKHFAHAFFIWVLVSLILTIIAAIVLFIVYGATFYEMFIIW